MSAHPELVARQRGQVARGPLWATVAGPAILGLIGWETATTVLQHRRAVEHEDWHKAVALLREKHRAGEPVLVAPEWAAPVARQHLAGLLPLELASLSDVDRFPRVWQLSMRDETHPWLRGLAPTQTFSRSRVTLSRYDKTPAQVLHDFRATLPRASVALVSDRRRTQCAKRGERFVCGPAPWSWVGLKLAEIDHRPYRCIYAHPVAEARLRLTYPAVPLGRKIVGYTGIDDFASRRGEKAPVYLQVFLGDTLARTIKQANEGHWTRFEVDTGTQRGEEQPVRFEVTTEDPRDRTFCFHAEVRR